MKQGIFEVDSFTVVIEKTNSHRVYVSGETVIVEGVDGGANLTVHCDCIPQFVAALEEAADVARRFKLGLFGE